MELNLTKFDPERPYNELPYLPPAVPLETVPVMRKCAEARAALAALDEAASALPDPTMLTNILPVLEAQSSSEIENVVTTADNLFRYSQIDPEQADGYTKEALRYRTALHHGFQSLQSSPLSTTTAVEVCSKIHNVEMDVRKGEVVHLKRRRTGFMIYTPPQGETVIRDLLTNWALYLHDDSDVDPLIRMAAAHYQFEAIHPFPDGNGRTGRVLNLLFLIDSGLLRLPVLYLSRYIISHRKDYYRLLVGVTQDGAWEPWLLYMLNAVSETATWTRDKISSIRALIEETAAKVRVDEPRIYSRELIDVIFAQPYCRISDVVEADIAQRQTASEYLKKLCAIDILEEHTYGRDRLYLNKRLMAALTE